MQIQSLPHKSVAPSAQGQARTNFDPAAIAQLADSIKQQGILQPLVVRPRAKERGVHAASPHPNDQYEIVCGERRWRASKGILENIPCIVRDLTDLDVAKIQLIENLQREGLDELDEARGFQTLREQHKLDIDQIAHSVQKKRTYVYARLKLTILPQYLQDALRTHQINASVALLLARIPDPAAQKQAAEHLLEGKTQWDPSTQTNPTVPYSEREASAFIAKNFMIRLKGAPFDTKDTLLLPKAGNCDNCPHRTGNILKDILGKPEGKERGVHAASPSPNPTDDPGLDLATLKKATDVCTKPACYHAKKDATWKAKAEAAHKLGQTTIDASHSEGVPGEQVQFRKDYSFTHDDEDDGGDKYKLTYDDHDNKYVELDAPCRFNKKGNRTWRYALRAELDPKEAILARDPSGKIHELYPRKLAAPIAAKAGLEIPDYFGKEQPHTSTFGQDPAEKARQKAAQTKARLAAEARDTAMAALVTALEDDTKFEQHTDHFWPLLTDALLRLQLYEGDRITFKRRQIQKEGKDYHDFPHHIRKAAKDYTPQQHRALAVELILANNAVDSQGHGFGDDFLVLTKLFRIDPAKIQETLVTQAKQKKQAKERGVHAASTPAKSKAKPTKKKAKS
jgi:ParB/RepB/Spo0J family partition protein